MDVTATTPFPVYLTVKGGEEVIAFYAQAIGATEEMKQMGEDGVRVMLATLAMLGHHIMLSDEFPEFGPDTVAPPSAGSTTATVHVNLADAKTVDTVIAKAEAAGAKGTMPAQKMFWGAYHGRIVDPFGHAWSFAAEH